MNWRYFISPLFYVNFLFFQWFFVRLTQHIDTDTGKTVKWSFTRWVVPVTGWWTNYIYWPRNVTKRVFK